MCCPCCASENYGFNSSFIVGKRRKNRRASTFNYLILMGSKKKTLKVSAVHTCNAWWDWVVRVPNMGPKIGHPASSRSQQTTPILDLCHGVSGVYLRTILENFSPQNGSSAMALPLLIRTHSKYKI